MRVQFHIASLVVTAAVVCQSVPPMVQAQGFELRAKTAAYQASRVYDRLTGSTRETFTLEESSRRFGLKSRVWLDVSFTYPGRRLTVAPEAVVLTLTSFTPARGGWAFARPHKLRVVSAKKVMLEAPAADYEKLRARLFDSGRRETLSFDIPTEQFVAMVAEPEIELKSGNARMRLRQRGMEMLREIARRLKPTAGAR
jgi:hypothetical protein